MGGRGLNIEELTDLGGDRLQIVLLSKKVEKRRNNDDSENFVCSRINTK